METGWYLNERMAGDPTNSIPLVVNVDWYTCLFIQHWVQRPWGFEPGDSEHETLALFMGL